MKLIRVLAAAIVLSACISSTVFAGTWKKNDIGYWYENEDGTYLQNRAKAIDGKTYYFDENGYMVTNRWMKAIVGWYYFGNDGAAVTNTWIGNYYLGNNGLMLKNTWTPDGYYVGSDGAWIENYQEDSANEDTSTENAYVGKYHGYPTIPESEIETLFKNYWSKELEVVSCDDEHITINYLGQKHSGTKSGHGYVVVWTQPTRTGGNRNTTGYRYELYIEEETVDLLIAYYEYTYPKYLSVTYSKSTD